MSSKKSLKSASGAIAIMTSGGDAPGMNGCLRGCVRSALENGREIYAILEGYQGLITGDFKPMKWEDVSGIINLGGTVIGTARSKEFRERSGLKKAVLNLLERHIDKLIVIGGDGSLSGAEELRQEWPGLLDELLSEGAITPEIRAAHPVLTVTGAVGSIDNDMLDSSMTIGADSALHRIVDAVDAITSTAFSHQRTFIIEVMGRNCGYLALMSALATGASRCFIPEAPPQKGWQKKLAQSINDDTAAGRRVNLIIVAEGARDENNAPLNAEIIHQILAEQGVDSRITILGHVQRGGTPSAFDRYMSTLFGLEAIKALDDPEKPSQIAVLQKNRVVLTNLTDAVSRTRAAGSELKKGNFQQASAMRGDEWERMVEIQRTMMLSSPPKESSRRRMRIGVVTAGRAASGANSAVRTIIRLGLASGADVLGIEEGPNGLINKKAHLCSWMEPELWNAFGGSKLGAGRYTEKRGDLSKIAKNFREWQLDGLLLIGDWGGYRLMDKIIAGRRYHPEFNIPMIALPASINNDLPGSEYSIGCDTALNAIVEAMDRIRNSTDTAKRSYVVEVMGRYSGYLACCAALATGAEYCYTPEKGITLDMLRHDVRELTEAFRQENRHTGLIVRNENADENYDTNFVAALFEADGGDEFDVRKAVLGPIQQGGRPTPFDRIQAVRLAYVGVQALLESVAMRMNSCCFAGLQEDEIRLHPWKEIRRYPDPWQRTRSKRWWQNYYDAITHLAINPAVRKKQR